MQFDQAFANWEFTEFLSLHGVNARLVPTKRHKKNVTESKHEVIRDIFLRVKSNNDYFCQIVAALQAICISNHLYGINTCSAHQLAKKFTHPIVPGILPKIVLKDLVTARETLMTKRNLNLILKSKSTSVTSV